MSCAFKKRVKPRALQRGDLVLKAIRGLIRDPKGKFRPNWSIPYFIRELTSEGATWLMDLNGNRFSKPINMDRLKSGASLEPSNQAHIFRHLYVVMLFIPRDPFLSHLVKPIFSDVVMILGCSYLKCIDSRIIISAEYSCGDDCFLRGLLQSTLLGRGMFIHIEGHNLDDVCRDEPSVEHNLRVRHSEPSSLLSFSIQSHLFNSAFRATFLVSSHHRFSVSSFRAIISSQVQCLEPSSVLNFGVEGHHFFQFGVQSHILSFNVRVTFSVSMFRAIIAFGLTLRAIIAS
ncbi:hypothetical protein AAG906_021364 [Vitis piasezkii]